MKKKLMGTVALLLTLAVTLGGCNRAVQMERADDTVEKEPVTTSMPAVQTTEADISETMLNEQESESGETIPEIEESEQVSVYKTPDALSAREMPMHESASVINEEIRLNMLDNAVLPPKKHVATDNAADTVMPLAAAEEVAEIPVTAIVQPTPPQPAPVVEATPAPVEAVPAESQTAPEPSVVIPEPYYDMERAEACLAIINQLREDNGRYALKWDEGLYQLAATRAKQYSVDHNDLSFYSQFDAIYGENTSGFESIGETVGLFPGEEIGITWMSSPDTLMHISNPYYSHAAVAFYCRQAENGPVMDCVLILAVFEDLQYAEEPWFEETAASSESQVVEETVAETAAPETVAETAAPQAAARTFPALEAVGVTGHGDIDAVIDDALNQMYARAEEGNLSLSQLSARDLANYVMLYVGVIYQYGEGTTAHDMITTGDGTCYAYSDTVFCFLRKLGISECWLTVPGRHVDHDGKFYGEQHRSVVARINGQYYDVDANMANNYYAFIAMGMPPEMEPISASYAEYLLGQRDTYDSFH